MRMLPTLLPNPVPAPALALSITHELHHPLAAVALHAAAAGTWLRRAEPDLAQAPDSLVEIDAAVRATLPLLYGRLHGVELELDLGLDDLAIDVDRAQLQQVLINLVINAAEAHTGSRLPIPRRKRIATGRRGAHAIELAVTDNGPGIAISDQPLLFAGRFSTKRTPGGAARGVGLSICLSIVRAHGGSIGHEPCAPHGACFRVRLPAH